MDIFYSSKMIRNQTGKPTENLDKFSRAGPILDEI